ncbi:2TM domain-containing protein [Corallibacter sp.]
MKPNFIEQDRVYRATKQVKRIKGFYSHLLVFIVINLMIMFINIQNLQPNESYFQFKNFVTLTFWGFGLFVHALSVFLPNFIFGAKWEERKIRELMEKNNNQWE